MPEPVSCDVLVVGSGAGGFSAAVTAAAEGLSVVMVEKSAWFGGTTCSSAGVVWIPGSRQARAAGVQDDPAEVLRYLESEAGDRLDHASARVYAEQAADILAWFEDHTHVDYALSPTWPDYHPTAPGGAPAGRSLGPKPFDGRLLGEHFPRLRPPIATTMLFGGMMVGREDLPRFYSILRSRQSALHVLRLYLRYRRDRLLGHPRGTRLSNGNALIAMLARSAFDRGVELRLSTPALRLLREGGRVAGAVVRGPAGEQEIRARRGVVLAAGGFPADETMTKQFFEHVAAGKGHRTLTPGTSTGDGWRMAVEVGADTVEDQLHPAAWTPVSLVPQPDGSTVPFPHFSDRGKAGYLAVDRRGRRFVNEAVSYHDFVPAMIEACRDDPDVSCHLVCDERAIRRYGLGMAPPPPGRLGRHLRSGYLVRARTIPELARACGIDPAGLRDTVERFNRAAVHGEDPEFGKGSDVYQRFNGSAGQTPNPCVAPLLKPPFYAMRLVPGDLGTFVGLKADEHGRVLRRDGRPIPGLYTAGNDAGSFLGGTYPGAGTSVGPALVFGHLAARHLATLDPAAPDPLQSNG